MSDLPDVKKKLDQDTTNIVNDIVNAEDTKEIKDLTQLFNIAQTKKNMLRIMQMNNLIDGVTQQMMERIEKRPGDFSNDELVSYLNSIQNALDKTNKNISPDDIPMITLSQTNNVNVSIGEQFDRESRERIAQAVKALLNSDLDKNEVIYVDKETNDVGSNNNDTSVSD